MELTYYKAWTWNSTTMWPSLGSGISFPWFAVNVICVIAVGIQLAHNLRSSCFELYQFSNINPFQCLGVSSCPP